MFMFIEMRVADLFIIFFTWSFLQEEIFILLILTFLKFIFHSNFRHN